MESKNQLVRNQVGKLQHWAMNLTRFQYKIEFIPGADKVWGNMLSRWGAAPVENLPARMGFLVIVYDRSPLEEKEFEWLMMNKVLEVQYEN